MKYKLALLLFVFLNLSCTAEKTMNSRQLSPAGPREGDILWQHVVGENIESTITIDENGNIYTTGGGCLHGVDLVDQGHHKAGILESHFEDKVEYRRVCRAEPWPEEFETKKFDIIIDATNGGRNVFPKIARVVRPQGILALLGFAGDQGQDDIAQVDISFLDAIVRGGIEIIGSVSASKQDMIDSLSFMASECPDQHLINDIIHPRVALSPQEAPDEIARLKRTGDYVKILIECHP